MNGGIIFMEELIVLRDLTDEEINDLSDDFIFELHQEYRKQGAPVRSTIRGLLEEFDIRYDDLTDFILNFDVGLCNYANRTKDMIHISRKNSPLKDNIVINLNDKLDIPDLTIQIQTKDDFVHEEAYTRDGLCLYES